MALVAAFAIDLSGRARQLTLAKHRVLRLFNDLSDAGAGENVLAASRVKASLLGQEAPKSWVHLAPYGEWNGHDSGPFAFTRDVFDAIIRNFDRQANQVPWTIGHPDETTPSEGWTLALQVRGDGSAMGDGLYALVEWGAEAASLIRAKKWQFCSVVIDLDSTDRVTNKPVGCELFEIGLTNTPFCDGQQPMSLTRHHMAKKNDQAAAAQAVLDEIAAALGAPNSDPDEIVKRVQAVAAYVTAMKSPDAPDAAPADVKASLANWAKVKVERFEKAKAARKAKLDADADPATMAATPDDSSMLAPGASAGADPDASTDKVIAALETATGLDDAGLAAAMQTNMDALVALLTGGGAPAEMEGGQGEEPDAGGAGGVGPTAVPAGEPGGQGSKPDAGAKGSTVAASRSPEVLALQARDKELSAKVAKLEAAEKSREAEAKDAAKKLAIKVALESGRLLKVELPHAESFFAKDHDGAIKWLSDKPATGPMLDRVTGRPGSESLGADGELDVDTGERLRTVAEKALRAQFPTKLSKAIDKDRFIRALTMHRRAVEDGPQTSAD